MKRYFIYITLLMLIVSCEKGPAPQANEIRFGMSADNWGGYEAQTRAMPITSVDNISEFQVFAHLGPTGMAGTTALFMDETVSRVNLHAIWTCANPHYWPGANYALRFFAYAPLSAADAITIKRTTDITADPSNATELTYTVPTVAEEQQDLLLSMALASDGSTNYFAGDTDPSTVVNFNFKHCLTAVQFKTGHYIDVKITDIRLVEIYGTGTIDMMAINPPADYNASTSGPYNPWTLSVPKTASVVIEIVDIMFDAPLNPNEKTFMLLPQTLPTGAKIEIDYEKEDGTSATSEIAIAGTTWGMNKVVLYTISQTKPDGEFTASTEVFEMDDNWSWDVMQGTTNGPEPLDPDNNMKW